MTAQRHASLQQLPVFAVNLPVPLDLTLPPDVTIITGRAAEAKEKLYGCSIPRRSPSLAGEVS